MTPIVGVVAVATFLWCYAAVLLIAWFRAVAREERRMHVAHFVQLMGVLVPVVSVFVLLIFVGAAFGIPIVVVLLAVLVPAGLVIAFHLEVSRLTGSGLRPELTRLGMALALSGIVFAWRATA